VRLLLGFKGMFRLSYMRYSSPIYMQHGCA
jgi:hypothetical protein